MPNKLIFPNPLAFYPFMHVIALWDTWCPRVSIALKNCFLYLQATPKDRENRLCTMNKVSKFKFFVWLAVATEASIEAKNVLDEKLALRGIFVARICVNPWGNLIQSSSPPLNNFMWFWTYWFVWDFSLCSFLGLFFPPWKFISLCISVHVDACSQGPSTLSVIIFFLIFFLSIIMLSKLWNGNQRNYNWGTQGVCQLLNPGKAFNENCPWKTRGKALNYVNHTYINHFSTYLFFHRKMMPLSNSRSSLLF